MRPCTFVVEAERYALRRCLNMKLDMIQTIDEYDRFCSFECDQSAGSNAPFGTATEKPCVLEVRGRSKSLWYGDVSQPAVRYRVNRTNHEIVTI